MYGGCLLCPLDSLLVLNYILVGCPWWFVVVFGINTTSDISKLLYIISLACEQALCFGKKKRGKGRDGGGGEVASPQTLGFVCHAFIQMKAWQRTPKDVCREAKESLDCFVIATLWSNRHLCADRKADVNQPCQQSVFSPMGPCIRIWCTAVANVCLQAFSLFPLPFFRSTKGLFTDYNFTSRSGEWNLTQFWNITDEWYLFQISHTNHAIICLYY